MHCIKLHWYYIDMDSCTVFCIIIIILLIVDLHLIVPFIYRQLKWAKELSDMRWKIDFEDVMLTNKKNMSKHGSSIGAVSHSLSSVTYWTLVTVQI